MLYPFLLPLSSLLNANAQTQRTLFTLIPLNARNENQYAVECTSGVAGIARMYTTKHHPLLHSSKRTVKRIHPAQTLTQSGCATSTATPTAQIRLPRMECKTKPTARNSPNRTPQYARSAKSTKNCFTRRGTQCAARQAPNTLQT